MLDGQNNQIDNLKAEDHNRRIVLKTIVGSSAALATFCALPTRWTTPDVDHVILPAHAATSGEVILIEHTLDSCIVELATTTETEKHFSVTTAISPPAAGINITIIFEAKSLGQTHPPQTTHVVTDADGSINASIIAPLTVQEAWVTVSIDDTEETTKCFYFIQAPVPIP
ncbi:hypothetical protein [Desulforhopalus singaporensis]|uniref:Uncharacterized protein n=1 Tax=Desulforhopalus singaporensis TaxID=91360 RepID=A0A1H0UBH0_9BACT|nr:hypothetical protein [Desulforhopalus singaporensis]SDP63652.1 hypothetical protein SAMN05660330_03484 [Desulforhopalus singaporensis]